MNYWVSEKTRGDEGARRDATHPARRDALVRAACGGHRAAAGGSAGRDGAGAQPDPLLIPCHRVIRSDGSAGEWGTGGSETKLRLLRLEGAVA